MFDLNLESILGESAGLSYKNSNEPAGHLVMMIEDTIVSTESTASKGVIALKRLASFSGYLEDVRKEKQAVEIYYSSESSIATKVLAKINEPVESTYRYNIDAIEFSEEGIKDTLKKVWEKIKETAKKVLEWIKEQYRKLANFISRLFGSTGYEPAKLKKKLKELKEKDYTKLSKEEFDESTKEHLNKVCPSYVYENSKIEANEMKNFIDQIGKIIDKADVHLDKKSSDIKSKIVGSNLAIDDKLKSILEKVYEINNKKIESNDNLTDIADKLKEYLTNVAAGVVETLTHYDILDKNHKPAEGLTVISQTKYKDEIKKDVKIQDGINNKIDILTHMRLGSKEVGLIHIGVKSDAVKEFSKLLEYANKKVDIDTTDATKLKESFKTKATELKTIIKNIRTNIKLGKVTYDVYEVREPNVDFKPIKIDDAISVVEKVENLAKDASKKSDDISKIIDKNAKAIEDDIKSIEDIVKDNINIDNLVSLYNEITQLIIKLDVENFKNLATLIMEQYKDLAKPSFLEPIVVTIPFYTKED